MTQMSMYEEIGAEELAIAIAQAGMDKKALDPVILDVRGKADYADFLVILTGKNDRHVAAVANGIDEEIAPLRACAGSEGVDEGQWVLLDFGDVVTHIFYAPNRRVFDLERLWKDVPRVEIEVPSECRGSQELYDAGEEDDDRYYVTVS